MIIVISLWHNLAFIMNQIFKTRFKSLEKMMTEFQFYNYPCPGAKEQTKMEPEYESGKMVLNQSQHFSVAINYMHDIQN